MNKHTHKTQIPVPSRHPEEARASRVDVVPKTCKFHPLQGNRPRRRSREPGAGQPRAPCRRLADPLRRRPRAAGAASRRGQGLAARHRGRAPGRAPPGPRAAGSRAVTPPGRAPPGPRAAASRAVWTRPPGGRAPLPSRAAPPLAGWAAAGSRGSRPGREPGQCRPPELPTRGTAAPWPRPRPSPGRAGQRAAPCAPPLHCQSLLFLKKRIRKRGREKKGKKWIGLGFPSLFI